MKLKIANINHEFDLSKHTQVIVENINFYRKIFDSFINKDDESIIFYKELFAPENYFKKIHVIYNYFDINLNEKSFFSEFLKQNKFDLNDEVCTIKEEIYNKVIKLMEVVNISSPVALKFNDEITIDDIFKMIKPIFNSGESVLENFINYCKLLVGLLNIEVIFAFNLNNYFSKEEIKKIYDELDLLDLKLFIISSNEMNFDDKDGIIYVKVDNDLCEF